MRLATQRIVPGCLIGLAIALLVVGGVSGTVLRHVIQILPILAAIVIVERMLRYRFLFSGSASLF
jgi:hypothetical protein